MKLALAMTLFTLSFAALAQNNIDQQIELRLETLSNKISNRAEHIRLNPSEKQDLLEHLKESVKILNLSSNNGPSNPGPGPGPQNPGPQNPGPQYPGPGYGARNTVEVFSDDNCSRPITQITNRDSCQMLTNVFSARQVWSVRVNNTCYDTVDTSFARSCNDVQPLVNEPIISQPVVQLYTDDNCSRSLIDLDPAVNYNAWSPVLNGKQIWSVRVEGQCVDTIDTNFSVNKANQLLNDALNMRGYEDPRAERIELFTDDNCSRSITTVSRGNSCQALSTFHGHKQVWSIKFRGRCENITDTTFARACDTYAR